jgi:hypothetical protein
MQIAACMASGHTVHYPWNIIRVPLIQIWPLDYSNVNRAEAGEGGVLQSLVYLVPSQFANLVIYASASADFEPHLINMCGGYLRQHLRDQRSVVVDAAKLDLKGT